MPSGAPDTVEASDLSMFSTAATTSTSSTESHQRSPTLPREICVLPNTVPYAQLCFPKDDGADRLCILMIGKISIPETKVTTGLHHQFKPLNVERYDERCDEEGKEETSPTLDKISSSQSSDTYGYSGSSAEVVELEDLRWVSNRWNDLSMDSSSSVSSIGSSGWESIMEASADDGDRNKPPENSVLQGSFWAEEIPDSFCWEPSNYSDALRLLGGSSANDQSSNNTDILPDLIAASGCGHFVRNIGFFRGGSVALKPYRKTLRRRRQAPTPPTMHQSVAPTSNEYSALT